MKNYRLVAERKANQFWFEMIKITVRNNKLCPFILEMEIRTFEKRLVYVCFFLSYISCEINDLNHIELVISVMAFAIFQWAGISKVLSRKEPWLGERRYARALLRKKSWVEIFCLSSHFSHQRLVWNHKDHFEKKLFF